MAKSRDRVRPLEEALRRSGLRITKQRSAIVQVLVEAEDHPDADAVHKRAQDIEETVSLSTVYRTLAALEDRGVINRHTFDQSSARFETADQPHHDHIIDVETGDVVEFTSKEIERLQREIARAHGYEVVSHRHELYCRKRRGPE